MLLILPVLFFTSCKKAIEKAQEKAVIDAITSGFWKVTQFNKGSTDVASTFTNYKFQFKENYTVDALKNNVVEKTGSWNGDPTAMTITSNFGNVSEPLLLLNGTWNITKSSISYVEANQTVNNELRFLRLDKE